MKDDKIINGVAIRAPETPSDRYWYSVIKAKLDALPKFGKLEIELTIQNGEVTIVKAHSEESFKVPGGA